MRNYPVTPRRGGTRTRMSALTSPLLLAVILASPSGAAPRQDGGSESGPKQVAAPAGESPDDAARAAIKEAPRRGKIGRLRGLKATSEVRFSSSPSDPYELVASFGIPDRARVVLANENGSFGRFQLGSRVFGRDIGPGSDAASFVMEGEGLRETLLDIELRRALFLWPDAPRFTGAGRTLTAKIRDFGVLMATVDESTGLPTKIQSFGQDGNAGAEFNAIQWTAAGKAERARPESLTFAAGGQAIWTETIQGVQTDWRFADTWFLPADRLTAVIGAKLAKQMHVRALEGAWIYRVPMTDLMPSSAVASASPIELATAIRAAVAEWPSARKRLGLLDGQSSPPALSPFVSLVLDPLGSPWAVEYETINTAEEQALDPSLWKWRAPENIWACPQANPKVGSAPAGVATASKALSGVYADEPGPKPNQRLRFRVSEERLDGKARAIGVNFALIVKVPEGSAQAPVDAQGETKANDNR